MTLEDTFASYTHTSDSEEARVGARNELQPFGDKIVFKQSLIDSSHVGTDCHLPKVDLIVVSPASDDVGTLLRMLRTARTFLKPGGYLLCPNVMRVETHKSKSIAGLGTISSPCSQSDTESNLPAGWRQMLEECNFTELDVYRHEASAVFLLQATDERCRILRQPIGTKCHHAQSSRITVVGGVTPSVSTVIDNIAEILDSDGVSIHRIRSISDLSTTEIAYGGDILVLQDHDRPIFDGLTAESLEGLKTLFEQSGNVLWVTHGYKNNQSHARMLVGFTRCLRLEMRHIRLQILDLPDCGHLDAALISEHLLRLVITREWKDAGRLNDMLWSFEPEISYADGYASIPRVKTNKDRNRRHRSLQHPINVSVDLNKIPVTASFGNTAYFLEAEIDYTTPLPTKQDELVDIRVTHSVLKTVKIAHYGYFYLVLGVEVASKAQVVALSSTLCSLIKIPRNCVRSWMPSSRDSLNQYRALFYGLVANEILRDIPSGGSVLIIEPQEEIAIILESLATARTIKFDFWVSDSTQLPAENGCTWKNMRSQPSKREVVSALARRNLSKVVVCKETTLIQHLRSSLSRTVPIDALASYIADTSSSSCVDTMSRATEILDNVHYQTRSVNQALNPENEPPVPLAGIHSLSNAIEEMRVIDWSVSDEVPVRIRPIKQRQLFSTGKVYWLVGLTGDLGLSLCQWMVQRGATRIALSSRNPRIDQRWLAHFDELGATVKVFRCDITDYAAVERTRNSIETDLGKVIGLCHGAMVLHDRLIHDLQMPSVEDVLKPKVHGALNLDKVFRNEHLDFFVMLSSIAAVLGNPGQAVYAAGNGFLAALTAARRKRGEAASCVSLGAILGCGYITRGLTLLQQEKLQKAGVRWMSEQNFHAAFAEAVITSPAKSGSSGEFTTGLRVCYTDEVCIPSCSSNLIFSHLQLQRSVKQQLQDAALPTLSMKAQLLGASTIQQVVYIVGTCFAMRLKQVLQMSEDAEVLDRTSEVLGIDSLIAVEVKSWFMREINVSMPVLIIIGGGTMRGVVTRCVDLLDPLLVPHLVTRADMKDKTQAKINTSINVGQPASPSDRRSVVGAQSTSTGNGVATTDVINRNDISGVLEIITTESHARSSENRRLDANSRLATCESLPTHRADSASLSLSASGTASGDFSHASPISSPDEKVLSSSQQTSSTRQADVKSSVIRSHNVAVVRFRSRLDRLNELLRVRFRRHRSPVGRI